MKLNSKKSELFKISFPMTFFLKSMLKSAKNGKNITHFTIQFRSKYLTYFTKFNSLNILKNILLQHSQNHYSLYKFSSKHVSGWCRKKHLHCTISAISRLPRTAFLRHLQSKCLYIPGCLCKNIFVPEM